MKKADVATGNHYIARVSGRLVVVRLDAVSRYGGWDGVNVVTGREVRIKSVARLRGEVEQRADGRWQAVTPARLLATGKGDCE